MLKLSNCIRSYSLRFNMYEKCNQNHYFNLYGGYTFGTNYLSIRREYTKKNNTFKKEKKSNLKTSEYEKGSSSIESFSNQSRLPESEERHIDFQNKNDMIEDIDFSHFFEKYNIPNDSLQLNPETSDMKIIPVGEILQNLHESHFQQNDLPGNYTKHKYNHNMGLKDMKNGYKKKLEFDTKKHTFNPNTNEDFKNLNYNSKNKLETVSNPVLKKSSSNTIVLKKIKKKKLKIATIDKRKNNVQNLKYSPKNNIRSVKESKHCESDNAPLSSHRLSPLNIQMLSEKLHSQIFGKLEKTKNQLEEEPEDLSRSIEHLTKQGLWGKEPSVIPDVDLTLPTLKSENLDEHFKMIAEGQCGPYKELLQELLSVDVPPIPTEWSYTPGWTRYNSDGTATKVDVPDCWALVFDVEVCVREGPKPTLAAAVSDKFWYSWCSSQLIDTEKCGSSEVMLDELIPLEKNIKIGKTENIPRVIVGHNVSYDRLRVSEQYLLQGTQLRFVDTMSLHIAVSGLVAEQRGLLLKDKSLPNKDKIKLPWMFVGCPNNLNDVYKFYCKKQEGLAKETRNIFVDGTLDDIRNDFQRLMTYCANDVKATHEVLVNLLPMFFERFPHPVTFSGMLEMGSTILPVTENWNKYINSSESEYKRLERLLNEELVCQAQKSLSFIENKNYENDLWLWCLDWNLPSKRARTLQNYPNWYRKLCARTGDREGTPEPENMSTGLQIVPRLLRLTWNGYPLHYERKQGWGYLKPTYSSLDKIPELKDNDSETTESSSDENSPVFPIKALYDMCCRLDPNVYEEKDVMTDDKEWESLLFSGNDNDVEFYQKSKKSAQIRKSTEHEHGVNIGIPGVTFIPLPHKNGPGNRVGNPLAKDFLGKIEDKTLSSYVENVAELVLITTKTISYWRNNRDRIMSQTVVWSEPNTFPDFMRTNRNFNPVAQYGVILPQVVSAGTITRRAVERTWMTASNAYPDRIGSELKAMIEAPPGYSFVGADVDSQELWIAAVLGDAYFAGKHGATALGWMTLQGKKSDGTDMHSRTAQTAEISRDNAKVINYGRIYGAGLKFMQRLLTQFNPNLSDDDVKQRAIELFATTKGQKGWLLNARGEQLAQEIGYEYKGLPLQRKEINSIVRRARKMNEDASFNEIVEGVPLWVGGSESHMFNCLEAIARSDKPKTPVLGARITRALEPDVVDDQFMTSRVNWVVQSSAVDYLHLMLVSMNWLFKEYNINGRFCISIHDEVRYLVKYEDRYRAALALQITNLLTRSLFALRLGVHDLPQSVAFFSGVDIDQVLRKESHLDCKTPSNPSGLTLGYGIPPGETLDIAKIIEITRGNLSSIDS